MLVAYLTSQISIMECTTLVHLTKLDGCAIACALKETFT